MRLPSLASLARTWTARHRGAGGRGTAHLRLVVPAEPTLSTPAPNPLSGTLLISLSHDLRTPLACILGSATTLDDFGASLDREAHGDLIRVIRVEAERLNRFLANLLDMTRLDAGAIQPRLRPVDLAPLVAETVERAARTLAAHRIVLQVPPRLVRVRLDPTLFEQLLFNVLENAAKFTPKGSEIRIRAWREDDRVRVSISDEGDGIPPADLDRIFDRFYRSRPTGGHRPGTGLGLAVCQGFVEAMGGTITAGNRRDRCGAVFTLVLPVAGEVVELGRRRGCGHD
jgi:two-component system sensor histidine kinase KdpD